MTACGVCLVVLAVVVWNWDVRGEHSVRVAIRLLLEIYFSRVSQELPAHPSGKGWRKGTAWKVKRVG